MTKQELESDVEVLKGRLENCEEYLEETRGELAEAVAKNDELRWAFKILAG